MRMRTLLALGALSLTVTACGSDSKAAPTGPGGGGGGGGTPNTFSASITGGVTKTINGTAAFAVDNMSDAIGFAFAFGSQSDAIIGWRGAAGLLGVGEHTVANFVELEEEQIPASQIVMSVVVTQNGVTYACAATGGKLTVTSSAANRVRGTMQVNALCASAADPEGEIPVVVNGQFDAAGGTVTIPD